MRKLIAAIAATMLLCGCDPTVRVYNEWSNMVVAIDLPEETTGGVSGYTVVESNTNIVITITLDKKVKKCN